MKKLIFLVAFLMLLVSGITVNAESDEVFAELKPQKYTETYPDRSTRFLRAVKTFDQAIMEAWADFEEEVLVQDFNIPVDEFGRVYRNAVCKDPKSYYYVSNGCGYVYNKTTNTIVKIFPYYNETDREVIKKTIDGIDEATEEIMMCLDENMTDFEKVMTVHDYMVLNYEYDYTYSNYSITIMTNKKGVCMSYALAFKHVMNELGIECLYVASGEEDMDHAWNLVKIDGKWYHIDLTWDDPGVSYAQVRHNYALLSDNEIQSMENPHYGYDLNGVVVNSDKYDKADWHEGIGAVATINNVYYYIDGKNLVDQNGKIIYENLDGGDGRWSVGGGYVLPDAVFTGLAEYNGLLFFNTDRMILAYSPAKEKILKVSDVLGSCGLFVDKNTLRYSKLDLESGQIVEGGSLLLGKIRFGGTFHNGNSVIKRIYREENADEMWIFADCPDCTQMKKIKTSGISKVSFECKDCQTIYFWDNNMKPLKSKEVYSNE